MGQRPHRHPARRSARPWATSSATSPPAWTPPSRAAAGGFSALASHGVKAGLRAAVNTSPEPVSNVAVSSAEDVTVAGVVSLAALHPWWAASIAATLLVVGVTLVVFLLGRIRRFKRRYDAWGVRRGYRRAARGRRRVAALPGPAEPDAAPDRRTARPSDPEVGVDLERRRRAVQRVEVQARRALGQQPLRTARWRSRRPTARTAAGSSATASSRATTAAAAASRTARPSGATCAKVVTGMRPGMIGRSRPAGHDPVAQPRRSCRRRRTNWVIANSAPASALATRTSASWSRLGGLGVPVGEGGHADAEVAQAAHQRDQLVGVVQPLGVRRPRAARAARRVAAQREHVAHAGVGVLARRPGAARPRTCPTQVRCAIGVSVVSRGDPAR